MCRVAISPALANTEVKNGGIESTSYEILSAIVTPLDYVRFMGRRYVMLCLARYETGEARIHTAFDSYMPLCADDGRHSERARGWV